MELLDRLLAMGNMTRSACACSAQTHVTDLEEQEPLGPPELCELALEYGWADLSLSTGHFAEDRILSRGHTGTIFRGMQEDGLPIAVKVLNGPAGSEFAHEVRLLSRCNHPNLVMLYGFAIHIEGLPPRRAQLMTSGKAGSLRDEEDPLAPNTSRALVYELLPGGSAYSRLHTSTESYFWQDRLQTGIDASRGLAHLHKFRPELFHRDIKSANILFAEDGTAKIADFGLACVSRLHSEAFSAVSVANGTPGYCAPEYESTGVVTEASEVYSMGMVLLELLTGRKTAKPAADNSYVFLVSDIRPDADGAVDRVLTHLDPRAGWPHRLAQDLAGFALQAIDHDPDRRPHFLETVAVLQKVLLVGLSFLAEPPPAMPVASAAPAPATEDEQSDPDVDESMTESRGEEPGTDGASASGAAMAAAPGAPEPMAILSTPQASASPAPAREPATVAGGVGAVGRQDTPEYATRSSPPPVGPIGWISRRLAASAVDRGAADPARIDGKWVHKNNPEVIECIRGDTISGADGTLTKIIARDKETITIEFQGSSFLATLVEDQLFWDDDDIWVRYQPNATTSAGATSVAGTGVHGVVESAQASPSTPAVPASPAPSPTPLPMTPALPVSSTPDVAATPASAPASAPATATRNTSPVGRLPFQCPHEAAGESDRKSAEGILGAERYNKLRHISQMGA